MWKRNQDIKDNIRRRIRKDSPFFVLRKRTYHLVSPSLTKRRRRDSNSRASKIITNFKVCFWLGWTWQVGLESFCLYVLFENKVSERCRESYNKIYFFCSFFKISITFGCVGINFTPRFNIPNTFFAFCSTSFTTCSLVSNK